MPPLPGWEEKVAPPRACDHPGCTEIGAHRAPRHRDRPGDYQWFCLPHVREFNARWNYFDGMSEAEIDAYQRGEATWHRPTWRLGMNSAANGRRMHDPLGVMAEDGMPRPDAASAAMPRETRRAFAVLELDSTTRGPAIRQRYKQLVKRFHPDHNGGDRSAEDRLRDVIQAYKRLRAEGFG